MPQFLGSDSFLYIMLHLFQMALQSELINESTDPTDQWTEKTCNYSMLPKSLFPLDKAEIMQF